MGPCPDACIWDLINPGNWNAPCWAFPLCPAAAVWLGYCPVQCRVWRLLFTSGRSFANLLGERLCFISQISGTDPPHVMCFTQVLFSEELLCRLVQVSVLLALMLVSIFPFCPSPWQKMIWLTSPDSGILAESKKVFSMPTHCWVSCGAVCRSEWHSQSLSSMCLCFSPSR